MKRFLAVLAIAGVGAIAYVATAPGALRTVPTPPQFAALRKQVGALQKEVKGLKQEADASFAVMGLCIMHQPVGVDQVGSSSSGYLFGPPQTAPTPVTATAGSALDLAPSTETSPQHVFFALNTSQQACVKLSTAVSTMAASRSIAAFAASR